MSPSLVKIAQVASKTIRSLIQRNRELSARTAVDSEKLATLEKERECRKLAMEMAERGHIDRSYESVEKAARGLLDKNLDVVKQAMDLTVKGIPFGQPAQAELSGGDDPITRVLLESN